MLHLIAFMSLVPPSTPVAEPRDSLEVRRAQLVQQRTEIEEKIAEIDASLVAIAAELAARVPPPAKWWYPVWPRG